MPRIAIRFALAGTLALAAPSLPAQTHAHAAEVSAAKPVVDRSALHMTMTPKRTPTHSDSARASLVAATLRTALAKYRDTTAAVADGYQMFMPQVKVQKVYHFTNKWHAVQEAFRFEPTKPTSLLYTKGADGRLTLVGAMYTAPKRVSAEKLDARVPLSIARWHQHVNWCVPKQGDATRWLERRDGEAVFGPESPIASKAACDTVKGKFHENVFGWMLHANVIAGTDAASIWGDEHAGQDMHAAMKMDGRE